MSCAYYSGSIFFEPLYLSSAHVNMRKMNIKHVIIDKLVFIYGKAHKKIMPAGRLSQSQLACYDWFIFGEGLKSMENERMPRPGQIYQHFKDKPYQIITIAEDTETGEAMVVYQALYGEFKTYVRSLAIFLSEVDHEKYPEVQQQYRFELRTASQTTSREVTTPMHSSEAAQTKADQGAISQIKADQGAISQIKADQLAVAQSKAELREAADSEKTEGSINAILLRFLDADTCRKKLDILTSNKKHMDDRLINDMAVALDCTIDEGPLEQRILGLEHCLLAMCRFEGRRLR